MNHCKLPGAVLTTCLIEAKMWKCCFACLKQKGDRSSRDTMEMEMKHDTNNGETKTGNENWNSLRQKMSYYPYQKMNEFTAPTGEQAPVETDEGNSTERTENNLPVIRNECNRRSISDTPNILHTGLSNLREGGF
nr:uncharacterized protein LOC111504082 isoform X2 [Leptinotarsa decemlineata]